MDLSDESELIVLCLLEQRERGVDLASWILVNLTFVVYHTHIRFHGIAGNDNNNLTFFQFLFWWGQTHSAEFCYMLKRISQLLCQKNLPDGHIFGQVQPSVRGGLEYQIEYRSIYIIYIIIYIQIDSRLTSFWASSTECPRRAMRSFWPASTSTICSGCQQMKWCSSYLVRIMVVDERFKMTI